MCVINVPSEHVEHMQTIIMNFWYVNMVNQTN